MNMTNHSFFNLSGEGRNRPGPRAFAGRLAAILRPTRLCFPTGELVPVRELPLILPLPRPSAREIGADDPALKANNGYDLNYVVNSWDGTMRRVASLSPKTGIQMDVYTDKPGVQLLPPTA